MDNETQSKDPSLQSQGCGTGCGCKSTAPKDAQPKEATKEIAKEIGGRKGPEPTRYGDWEMAGKCVDF